MNIKTLITTLAILGSSSVAMARPVTYSASAEATASFSWGTPAFTRPVVRDHRTIAPIIVPPAPVRRATFQVGNWNSYSNYDNSRVRSYEPQPLVLEAGLQFADHEYRKDIVMGATNERFNTLRFDASGGNTFLMKVVIEFADGGAVQQIDINRTLSGNQSMSIDLSGSNRKLHRILVYRADGGEALNMNRRHYGAFTVSAL